MARPETACILALVAFLTACGAGAACPDATSPATVTFAGGETLTVRIADEPDERTQGLMGVASLPEDEGVAFVWDEPHDGTFWMKDTLIPLSVAFVDDRDRIVTIRDMAPCEREPCAHYGASEPYVLAIEANAGWFEERGIGEGDRLEDFAASSCG